MVSGGVLVFLIFLQNYSKHHILWSLCSVVFHAFTLRLPIQTSLSVAPKLQVCLRSGEKCEKFRKTSTPLNTVHTEQQQISFFHIRCMKNESDIAADGLIENPI